MPFRPQTVTSTAATAEAPGTLTGAGMKEVWNAPNATGPPVTIAEIVWRSGALSLTVSMVYGGRGLLRFKGVADVVIQVSLEGSKPRPQRKTLGPPIAHWPISCTE